MYVSLLTKSYLCINAVIFSDGFPSLQIDIHPAFVQSFNDAVQFYIAGDWKTAKRLLEVIFISILDLMWVQIRDMITNQSYLYCIL